MSNFFDETMQGLLEAAEIAKGNIPLTERENMPAPTFYVVDNDITALGYEVQLVKKAESKSRISMSRLPCPGAGSFDIL